MGWRFRIVFFAPGAAKLYVEHHDTLGAACARASALLLKGAHPIQVQEEVNGRWIAVQ